MPQQGEVLVAIVNTLQDRDIAYEQHWYRIPVEAIEKRFQTYGLPQWLALYQTKAFGSEAYMIHAYARVETISIVDRAALFPDQPLQDNSQKRYYKLALSPFVDLPQSIVNTRKRRITFIFTTLVKLTTAIAVTDL